jgi:hypothetical protein
MFTTEQQGRQSRVGGSLMEKGKFKKGISDENDNEIQASHSSIAVNSLRRPRRYASGRMCRGAIHGI